jgi:hypothetical protein
LFYLACFKSSLAHVLSSRGLKHKQEVDDALEYLRGWLELGINGGWKQVSRNPKSEINAMSKDIDLYYVLSRRKTEIQKIIPDGLQSAISWKAVRKRASRYVGRGKK